MAETIPDRPTIRAGCEACISMARENERLRKIEVAARALKFSAYPAHGSGFVLQVIGGNINDLEAALRAE